MIYAILLNYTIQEIGIQHRSGQNKPVGSITCLWANSMQRCHQCTQGIEAIQISSVNFMEERKCRASVMSELETKAAKCAQ
jgi:hypothetical protein